MSQELPYSIIDSAKYGIGETVWFLALNSPDGYHFGEAYDFLMLEHPIFTYMRTPLKHHWRTGRALPKLEEGSFDLITSLLTSKILIRSMVVESIERSENTGEFVYFDIEQEVCLPEQVLYSSRKDAQRELTRILKMIKDWATAQLDSKNEMFPMRRSGSKQPNRRTHRRSGESRNPKS